MVFANYTTQEIVMNCYAHLTPMEREMIMIWHNAGFKNKDIAQYIARSESTISRELKRNKCNKHYSCFKAQEKYMRRRKACRMKQKFDNPQLKELVRNCIVDGHWSPEEISGRLREESSEFQVSYSTIYRAIHSGKLNKSGAYGRELILKLRRKGRKRKPQAEKRGKITISHTISERPCEANDRSRIGDWEGDTVAGCLNGSCLVTLTDRKSRYLLCGKAADKMSKSVTLVMLNLLKKVPLKTITLDRGKEFSKHVEITKKLKTEVYYAYPHQPWARGTNENTNGLLREYFPKGKDITPISEEEISRNVYNLNTRPRKCLGYKTPFEIFFSTKLHLV